MLLEPFRPLGTTSRSFTVKLDRMHKAATNFCRRHNDACRQEFGEDMQAIDRIETSDPCRCINGITGGYRSFFNRLAKNAGLSDDDAKIRNRREHAVPDRGGCGFLSELWRAADRGLLS